MARHLAPPPFNNLSHTIQPPIPIQWCRLFGTGSTPYWRECWCLEVYLRWEDVADWTVDRALGQWHED